MSKAKFFKLAESAGIEVDYWAGRAHHPRTGERIAYEMLLDAPQGKIFNSSGCHCDGAIGGRDSGDGIIEITPNWNTAIKILQSIINDGFEDCTDSDCDICNSEGVE